MSPDADRAVLLPAPRPRVVGPGRLERTYRGKVAELESALEATSRRERDLARELEVLERLERGSQRLLDRLEAGREEDRRELGTAAQREKRLILALGAMQRENELMRRELFALPPRAEPPHPTARSWIRRLLGRTRRAPRPRAGGESRRRA